MDMKYVLVGGLAVLLPIGAVFVTRMNAPDGSLDLSLTMIGVVVFIGGFVALAAGIMSDPKSQTS